MATDANEIREAIEQTRGDIGDTLQAIGHKADIKARASEKVAEGRETLKDSAAEAKAKLGDVAQRVEQRLPEAAQPAVSSTAEWAKSAAQPVGAMWRRQKVAVRIGVAMVVLVLLVRRSRRRRLEPC